MSGTRGQRRSKRGRVGSEEECSTYTDLPPQIGDDDDGGESSKNETIHPLLIHVVVARILDYVDPSELDNFRLVCSVWGRISLKRFRRSRIFRIGPSNGKPCRGGGQGQDGNQPDDALSNHQVKKLLREQGTFFTKNWDQLAKHPFTELKLHSIDLRMNVLSASCALKLSGYLVFIRHLSISNVQLETNCIPILHSVLFENTPNLEDLRLVNVSEMEGSAVLVDPLEYPVKKDRQQLNLKTFMASVERNAVFSWVDIFSWFPKIQALSLGLHNISHFSLVLSSLNTAHIVNGQTSCITSLTLAGPCCEMCTLREEYAPGFDPSFRRLLRTVYPQMPIQGLTVDEKILLSDLSEPYSLDILLGSHKASLKRLALHLHLGPGPLLDVFEIKMTNLEEVVLDMEVLNATPIKMLQPVFASLFSWMQNVQRLEMDLCNETFHEMCKICVRLTHLTVIDGYAVHRKLWLDDEGITGLKQGQGKKFLEKLQLSGLQRPANITDLKELKVFVVHRDYVRFSDKSVYEGFLKLDNLETLNFPKMKLSAKALAELHRHLPSL